MKFKLQVMQGACLDRHEQSSVKTLTNKQQRFSDLLFLNGLKVSRAAKDSGISETAAFSMMKNPAVKAYLKILGYENRNQNIESKDWKLGKLKAMVNICLPDDISNEIALLDKEALKVAISAIAELNRMEGHYSPTRTENKNLNVNMTPDEVEEVNTLIAQYRREY